MDVNPRLCGNGQDFPQFRYAVANGIALTSVESADNADVMGLSLVDTGPGPVEDLQAPEIAGL